jgi:hypothetical protein
MPDDMPRLPESDYESETRPSPPDLLDLESTRASAPIDVTRAMPPVTDRGHVQASGDYMLSGSRDGQPRRQPDRRERRPREPRKSGFYLPVWSVALMLILVFAVASGVILLVLSLGGQTAPESGPRFVIVTAVPTTAPAVEQALPASPTISIEFDPGSQSEPQSFALEGPTLEAVVLSPTPETIAIGKQVIVIDAEDSGLNVRSGAGLDNEVRFIADNGETFTIIGGPTQADSISWWQIQDPADNSRSGWASASYLQVVTQ